MSNSEIPRTCGECNFSEMKQYKETPEQRVCTFTERPVYYYIGEHRKECPLPESLADKADNMAHCCGTCIWSYLEPIDKGWVCVNSDSDKCADWVDYWHTCDNWRANQW